MMKKSGYVIVNADMTILTQEPRLAPYFKSMRNNIARLAHIPPSQVNVKAGTTEKLGWLGQAKGMMATAVVLLRKMPERNRRNS
jgi:2-C-methyl-D-erythritol 2,4-cyclodiphosphate synthase